MNDLLLSLGSTYRTAQLSAGSIGYDKNNVRSLELPPNLLQRGIVMRLTGNLTIGVANATVFSEAPLGLLRKLEIIGDGRRYLVSASGRDLYRMAHFTWGKAPELSAPSNVVGTRAFSATIRFDHEAMHMMDPSESLFDPRLFKQVKLALTWGAETDIATAGGGGTIAIDTANTSLDVFVDQTAEGVNKILFDRLISFEEKDVTATGTLSFEVPQNGLLAGFWIRADRDSGAGAGPVPVDDLVTAISLKSDQTVVHVDGIRWATQQRWNTLKYQLDGGATTGAQIPGWVYVDLTENGMFSSALNVNALNKLQVRLDVTRTAGTEMVRVVYNFFEPRRGLATSVE